MSDQRFESVWEAIEDSAASAVNLKARSDLMIAIREVVDGWTKAEAARRLRITGPRLNDLVHGRIDKFSLDALLNLAVQAGLSVYVKAAPPADSSSEAASSADASSGTTPLADVATSSYLPRMTIVSMKEAKNRLTELARLVEQGESVVITRNGKPVLDLVPHKPKGGLNLEAGREYLRKLGVTELVSYIADDFDEPLPEDFLITPLLD